MIVFQLHRSHQVVKELWICLICLVYFCFGTSAHVTQILLLWKVAYGYPKELKIYVYVKYSFQWIPWMLEICCLKPTAAIAIKTLLFILSLPYTIMIYVRGHHEEHGFLFDPCTSWAFFILLFFLASGLLISDLLQPCFCKVLCDDIYFKCATQLKQINNNIII